MDLRDKNDYLNVFKYGYMNKRNIRNWIPNLIMFFRNCKRAWDRATKGFCDWDTWELFSYYGHVFSNSLNYLADHHMGYPNRDDITSDEEWVKMLHTMADKFQEALREYCDDPAVSAAEDKYLEYKDRMGIKGSIAFFFHPDLDAEGMALFNEITKLETEAQERIDKDKDDAFDLMKKYFYNLWD